MKKINTYLRTDQDSFVKVAWKKTVNFCIFIMKLKTFLGHVDYSCAFKILRFFVFVLVTCPVKATQLMKFITGSEKIPLVGLLLLYCLNTIVGLGVTEAIVDVCQLWALVVFLLNWQFTLSQRDSFEMVINNEISFDIV